MKKLKILFLLIPVFLSPMLSVYGEIEHNDKQIDDLIENAHKLLEQGKYAEALGVFEFLITNFDVDLDVLEKIIYQEDITNSKYQGYAQIEIRNTDGGLVGFVETSMITYVPIAMDAYLDQFEIVEMVQDNGKAFEKRIVKQSSQAKKDNFVLGPIPFIMIRENYQTLVFHVLPPGLIAESSDTIIITVTIKIGSKSRYGKSFVRKRI